MEKKNRIAVTCGDPAGIGPEVALKAAHEFLDTEGPQLVIIGRGSLLRSMHPALCEKIPLVQNLDDSSARVIILDQSGFSAPVESGCGSVETGRESLAYIDNALDLWRQGAVKAIVTGPVHKGLIEQGGIAFTGHTEYIADFAGEKNPCMMMFSPEYRVVPATTHIPVSRVTECVTEESLLKLIETIDVSISLIDNKKAKLAITGMDPHCGDNGAIGDFDLKVTAAVVDKAKKKGIDITGPLAADTVFLPQKWKKFSCVIAHYHDQGLIPFKVLAFDSGVNVTLGLSIVRTSVDHGTAFDIAGKNIAAHSSMVAAIDCAESLAKLRI